MNGQWVNLDKKDERDVGTSPRLRSVRDEDGARSRDNDLAGTSTIRSVQETIPRHRHWDDEDGCPITTTTRTALRPGGSSRRASSRSMWRLQGKESLSRTAEDYDGERDEDGCPIFKAESTAISVKISEKVFFKFNKWDLDPRSFPLLDDVATVMNQVPEELHFRVEGHPDSKGRTSTTRSCRRTARTRSPDSSGQGVKSNRVAPVGFGEGSRSTATRPTMVALATVASIQRLQRGLQAHPVSRPSAPTSLGSTPPRRCDRGGAAGIPLPSRGGPRDDVRNATRPRRSSIKTSTSTPRSRGSMPRSPAPKGPGSRTIRRSVRCTCCAGAASSSRTMGNRAQDARRVQAGDRVRLELALHDQLRSPDVQKILD